MPGITSTCTIISGTKCKLAYSILQVICARYPLGLESLDYSIKAIEEISDQHEEMTLIRSIGHTRQAVYKIL